MATKPIVYKIPPMPKQPPPFRLERIDGGINVRDEQSQIADSQSPYDYENLRPANLNMVSDGRGGVQKRKGQQEVYDTTLGAGAVNGYFDYTKMDGTTVTVLFWGTKIYTQSGSSQPVEIYSGVANQRVTLFPFEDILYILDGTSYLEYNGTAVSAVTGYVPTITLGRAPSGGGTANEDLNYISDSWIDSFSGTVGDTEYYVSFADVDSFDAVYANDALIDPADYTEDLAAGKITFDVAPGEGTDNITIQATKSGLMDSTVITNNKYVALYGGENDTRVHLTGNVDSPSAVYWCGLTDPTYWPESNFNLIGSDADFNTGLLVHYDQLLLFKNRSIHRIDFEIVSGEATFPSRPLRDTIGCDMPYSIQTIDNFPVFCNTYKGPQILTRTDVREEKNVRPIGGLINGSPSRLGLLDEAKADLQAATSVDDGTHYILCVGTKVWAWDYKDTPYSGDEDKLAWFYWDNINANVWLVRDRDLYYGDRDTGLVQKFIENKNDNGTAINGVWRSKLFHFTLPEWLKTINLVYFRTNVVNYGNITIKLLSDNGEVLTSKTVNTSSFSWATFTWATFSWFVSRYDPTFRLKPKIKKVVYFQIEFSNNEINQNLSILDLVIYYALNRKVK